MFYEQPRCKFSNGGFDICRQTLERQKELTLFGLDTGVSGNSLAERNELPDLATEFCQMAVIFSREISACNHVCRVTNALRRAARRSSFHSRDKPVKPDTSEEQHARNDRARQDCLVESGEIRVQSCRHQPDLNNQKDQDQRHGPIDRAQAAGPYYIVLYRRALYRRGLYCGGSVHQLS